MIAEYNSPRDPSPGGGDAPDSGDSEIGNRGTLILDATCAPQQISYPRDVNLLNEARENLEAILDKICYEYNYYKPGMYRQKAAAIRFFIKENFYVRIKSDRRKKLLY